MSTHPKLMLYFKWYYAPWVDAFYSVLGGDEGNDTFGGGSSIHRPTEQAAFRSLAVQSIYGMRLRYVDELRETAYE